MEMNLTLDRAKLAELRRYRPDGVPVFRRKSRAERIGAELRELSPAVRIGLAAGATVLMVGLAYLLRRRLLAAGEVVAEVVEEAADAVEDAAEGLGDAARERAETASN
jgi:hypothetical protein